MSQELIWMIKPFLLPPGILILLGLLGLMLSGRLFGRFLLLITLAALYLSSTGFVTQHLAAELQSEPALDPAHIRDQGAQAIVVLGGGRYLDAPEYGKDTVSAELLERLRYAAWLSRHSGLPVIPSGGSDPQEGRSEAEAARETLEQEFGVQVIAVEDQSRTTYENASYTHSLLNRLRIHKVLLVTHALHMPRALQAFRAAGVDAIPAPTGFIRLREPVVEDWLPSAAALEKNSCAIHEIIGQLWYRLRGV